MMALVIWNQWLRSRNLALLALTFTQPLGIGLGWIACMHASGLGQSVDIKATRLTSIRIQSLFSQGVGERML